MVEQNNLVKKLNEIADLEKKYNVLGVSFAVRDGISVSTENSVDYVRNVILRNINLLEKKNLYNPGYSPPN